MLAAKPNRPVCAACSRRVLQYFVRGFGTVLPCPPRRPLIVRELSRVGKRAAHAPALRLNNALAARTNRRAYSQDVSESTKTAAFVRRTRETFGENLPPEFLTPDELTVYERLYGHPLRRTLPEEVVSLQNGDTVGQEIPSVTDFSNGSPSDSPGFARAEEEVTESQVVQDKSSSRTPETERLRLEDESKQEFRARVNVFRDIAAATEGAATESSPESELVFEEDLEKENYQDLDTEEAAVEDEYAASGQDELDLDLDSEAQEAHERAHPHTTAGRFGTFPATLKLPKATFVDKIGQTITNASNKHLDQVTLRTFGGSGLPDSIATPFAARHLQQKPIALEASQFKMGEMEANAYMAAIMPGAYATVMSTLVEVRKRLGSAWLKSLLNKPDGPRFLDAGAAGAGAIAWQNVLNAEWERMYPDEPNNPVSLGKNTVIAGSSELRRRVSTLLENTTFLPRLPDFIPARDLPGSESHNPEMRKQYDVIVAPHTLWTLKEDYIRKAQIQNYWTLLNPNGGVLIIIEKGVPHGFELVAGARDLLLNHHISSPESLDNENELSSPSTGRFTKKEEGMIIAPCTNHKQCPMYLTQGEMKGRKDHCHFSQRYERPSFLQRILGAKTHNHEDIRFSYVAARRGIDERKTSNVSQDETATQAALTGFEDEAASPSYLTLPRILLPPIKRHKHVTFDLCTPAGTLERWTLPKSFSRQGYRDARKAKWGDLWALGAKTRVVRTARSGTPRHIPKKRVIEVGVGAHEGEDTLRDVTRGTDSVKRGKRKKREKRPKMLTEKDL